VRTFAEDLKQAKAERVPRMALRPFKSLPDQPDLMDDVVVEHPSMFRMEQMDDASVWLCCYFANGERVTFWATADFEQEAPGKRRFPVLNVSVTEKPAEWIDIDAERRP
jgi:hypothetical protein